MCSPIYLPIILCVGNIIITGLLQYVEIVNKGDMYFCTCNLHMISKVESSECNTAEEVSFPEKKSAASCGIRTHNTAL